MRFIAKKRADGTWGVYDTEYASWPGARAQPIGYVNQIHETEQAAAEEARRLEEATG